MLQSQVTIDINNDEIKKYIRERLDASIMHERLFIDINDLVEITSCSKNWLENELLKDPRIRIHERRKSRKRLWLYKETVEAIKKISNEW